MRNTRKGYIVLLVILLTTISLWIMAKLSSGESFDSKITNIYLAQISGLIGVTLLSINFILSARFKYVEGLFGGLDKVFRIHAWVGRFAFVFIFLHPTSLALKYLGNWDVLRFYIFPSSEFTDYTAGIVAFYLLSSLIFLTVIKPLPYHIWKWSHKFMGIVLIFVILHVTRIQSDILVYDPLRYWILLLLFFAFCSYIFREFLYSKFGPVYEYIVDSVNTKNEITNLKMKAVDKEMIYSSGQFAFWQFKNKKTGNELHPFTISSSPNDKLLQINTKNLGDYTSKMSEIKAGDSVRVFGPYGFFSRKFLPKCFNEVWIAGGIGITPFLSMLASENTGKKIILFYTTKSKYEDNFDEYIRKQIENAGKLKNVSLVRHYSEESGWLDMKFVLEECKKQGIEVKGSSTNFLMCGPEGMLKSLQKQAVVNGVPKGRLFFEVFKLR